MSTLPESTILPFTYLIIIKLSGKCGQCLFYQPGDREGPVSYPTVEDDECQGVCIEVRLQ